MRKSWKVIKDIIGNRPNSTDNQMFVVNEIETGNAQDITNEFNNYFVSIGKELANKILNNGINPLTYIKENEQNIQTLITNEQYVRNIVKTVNNCSPGWDKLNPNICKQTIDCYARELTQLLNQSYDQGIFPDELKMAKVVPLFKQGKTSLIENYRPVSILNYFSKFFEKIMYNHIIEFLNENNILSKYQFGFRQKHSTNHALITIVEKIARALDNKQQVIGVYLDFRKAFDTVDHQILLSKLQKYGIRGKTLEWFQSYLHNRTQYVEYNNSHSTVKHISMGVPQGSILGPLLFLIYVNDISDVSDKLYSILFADDTNVFIEGSNLNNLINTLNEELHKLTMWLDSNKLTINLSKTHYMIFHRSRIKQSNDATINVLLNNTPIMKVNSTKFLGVIIDNKLNWTEHILAVKRKIARGLAILCKIRKKLDKRVLKQMYYSYIECHLIYCIEIWGNTNKTNITSLFRLQKKAIRLITYSHYRAHTEQLFMSLNILPLLKLVQYRIAIMMFKFSNNELPIALTPLFVYNNNTHNYNTRTGNLLRPTRANTEHMYKSFSAQSVHIWNEISHRINTEVSLCSFKHLLRKYLFLNDLNIKYSR